MKEGEIGGGVVVFCGLCEKILKWKGAESALLEGEIEDETKRTFGYSEEDGNYAKANDA